MSKYQITFKDGTKFFGISPAGTPGLRYNHHIYLSGESFNINDIAYLQAWDCVNGLSQNKLEPLKLYDNWEHNKDYDPNQAAG